MDSACGPHVHFGAGRLGLGLVLPILVERQRQNPAARFAVFQRPNRECWQCMQGARDVDVAVNGRLVARLRCVTDHTDAAAVRALLEQPHEPLLVSTHRVELLAPILARARTFSTAVGVAGLGGVSEGLALAPPAGARRPLFAFENDAAAVRELSAAVERYAQVVPVCCDRICVERRILPGRIELACEAYPGCAVLCLRAPWRPELFSLPPLLQGAPELIRKFLLLNCTHTVMALWCYIDLHRSGAPRDKWGDRDVREWRAQAGRGRLLALLLSARAHQLLHETPLTVVAGAYGSGDLRRAMRATTAYASAVVGRILSRGDSVGRILDLANEEAAERKLATRFHDLCAFAHSEMFAARCGNRRKVQATRRTLDALASDVRQLLRGVEPLRDRLAPVVREAASVGLSVLA